MSQDNLINVDLRQHSVKEPGTGLDDAKQLIGGTAGTIMTNG